MVKQVSSSSKGFIDPLSIISVLFLVVTLVVGTAVTTNKNFSLNISEKAAKMGLIPDEEWTDPPPKVSTPDFSDKNFYKLEKDEEEFIEEAEEQAAEQLVTEQQTVTPQTTNTTSTADQENLDREKSQCLQEGGSWFANICSYAQQQQAIATFAPIIQNQLETEESAFIQGVVEQEAKTQADIPTVKNPTQSNDFMLGIYYGINPDTSGSQKPLESNTIEFLKDKGLNTLIVTASPWLNNQEISNLQQNAEQYDVDLIWGIDMLSNYYASGVNQSNIQLNEDLIKFLAKSSSLAGFYALDEPTKEKVSNPLYPNQKNNIYEQLINLSPNTPIMTVFFPITEYVEYQNTAKEFIKQSNTNIVGTDPYYWSVDPSAQVYENISYTNNLINSGQLGSSVENQVAILSAHSDLPGRTQESFQYQAVSAVTAGANGVIWWDWGSGCTQENCGGGTPNQSGYSTYMDNISATAQILQDAMPGLTGETLRITNNDVVSYRVNQAIDNQAYIFAISNSGDLSPSVASQNIPNNYPPAIFDDMFKLQQYLGNQQVSLTNLPTNSAFNVIGEDRVVTTNSRGILNDIFGIMSSHIYQQIMP